MGRMFVLRVGFGAQKTQEQATTGNFPDKYFHRAEPPYPRKDRRCQAALLVSQWLPHCILGAAASSAARYLDWTLLLRSHNKWRALKNKSPSFGGHTRNRLAAVATVNAETLVSRQDDKVGESFAHAHQTSIGEAHRDVAALLYEP